MVCTDQDVVLHVEPVSTTHIVTISTVAVYRGVVRLELDPFFISKKRGEPKKYFHVVKCSSGTYGINCKETCSINCDVSKNCNRTTGECLGGCQPGWKGFHCDQRIVAKSFKNTKDLLLHIVYNLRSTFELKSAFFYFNKSDFWQIKYNLKWFFFNYFKNACSQSVFYVLRMQPGNVRKRLSTYMWFLH